MKQVKLVILFLGNKKVKAKENKIEEFKGNMEKIGAINPFDVILPMLDEIYQNLPSKNKEKSLGNDPSMKIKEKSQKIKDERKIILQSCVKKDSQEKEKIREKIITKKKGKVEITNEKIKTLALSKKRKSLICHSSKNTYMAAKFQTGAILYSKEKKINLKFFIGNSNQNIIKKNRQVHRHNIRKRKILDIRRELRNLLKRN